MSDRVTEIREALAEVESPQWWPSEDHKIVLEAARAYADLLENGVEVETLIDRQGFSYLPGSVVIDEAPGRYLVVRVAEAADEQD